MKKAYLFAISLTACLTVGTSITAFAEQGIGIISESGPEAEPGTETGTGYGTGPGSASGPGAMSGPGSSSGFGSGPSWSSGQGTIISHGSSGANWVYLSYNNGSDWYDSDSTLSDGDKAAYHYINHYLRYPENYNYSNIGEQYQRLLDNPNPETAVNEMTWVEVPVWRLKNGQKVSDTERVQVLSSVAADVREIFTEIYNGPEQFPISSIGGYTWRQNGLKSYHSAGLAIDINPEHNPQVREDGTIISGGAWQPGINPYSIGRDSDVVKAFGKHGWTWGAAFRTKDYMHFEF
jgi:hypothetical protein